MGRAGLNNYDRRSQFSTSLGSGKSLKQMAFHTDESVTCEATKGAKQKVNILV